MTDILFFIPSSYVHRFKQHPAVAQWIDMRDQESDYLTIHRDICKYFRSQLEHKVSWFTVNLARAKTNKLLAS
jgi:hypothetical protein